MLKAKLDSPAPQEALAVVCPAVTELPDSPALPALKANLAHPDLADQDQLVSDKT